MDAMNMWYASHPQLFQHSTGSNRPECDIQAVPGDLSRHGKQVVIYLIVDGRRDMQSLLARRLLEA
jgi:hypothetical protein